MGELRSRNENGNRWCGRQVRHLLQNMLETRTSESCKISEKDHIHLLDSQGMLLQHPVPSGQTVNKKNMYYQKVYLFYT